MYPLDGDHMLCVPGYKDPSVTFDVDLKLRAHVAKYFKDASQLTNSY